MSLLQEHKQDEWDVEYFDTGLDSLDPNDDDLLAITSAPEDFLPEVFDDWLANLELSDEYHEELSRKSVDDYDEYHGELVLKARELLVDEVGDLD